MAQLDDNSQSQFVSPLMKRKRNGELYLRPAQVITGVCLLSQLLLSELVERARIDETDHPDYVSSECLLYFVRRQKDGDDRTLQELFLILRGRVLKAVPMPARGDADRMFDLEVRERVLDTFQEFLCRDRCAYEDRLDFYEVRFNSALAKLRMTVRRVVYRDHKRFAPLHVEDTEGNPLPGAEAWMETFCSASDEYEDRLNYRSKQYAAISQLPPNGKRVINLLLEGYLIDSQDESVRTITKILGCSEKTVRNRRDRAIVTLRAAMEEENT